MNNSSDNHLEQAVIAGLEKSAALGEQMRELQAALREGRRLPVSGNPLDWPSLRARLTALTTLDEGILKSLEESARINNIELKP
ncbi:MAG: hypothetical protein WBV94_21655 [Blastocatellia bacterium]